MPAPVWMFACTVIRNGWVRQAFGATALFIAGRGYTIRALFGLGIFGLYTVLDFNRLRRAGTEEAVPIAASIFLDVLNVFLLFLRLFARSS